MIELIGYILGFGTYTSIGFAIVSLTSSEKTWRDWIILAAIWPLVLWLLIFSTLIKHARF